MHQYDHPWQEYIKFLSQRLRAINDRKLQEYGLTAQQAILLGVIHRQQKSGDSVNRQQLQQVMQLSGPSVTSLIGGLVRGGFLMRGTGAGDARTFRLEITPRGNAVIEEMDLVFERSQQQMLTGMTAAEQALFLQLLERAHRNLSGS